MASFQGAQGTQLQRVAIQLVQDDGKVDGSCHIPTNYKKPRKLTRKELKLLPPEVFLMMQVFRYLLYTFSSHIYEYTV